MAPWRAHGFPGVCSAASVRPSLMLVVRRRPPSIRALRWTLTLGARRRWRIHSGGGSLLVALVIIRVAESTAASLLRVGKLVVGGVSAVEAEASSSISSAVAWKSLVHPSPHRASS